MPTQREKIIKKAYEILERKPDGIRYADLIRKIIAFFIMSSANFSLYFNTN